MSRAAKYIDAVSTLYLQYLSAKSALPTLNSMVPVLEQVRDTIFSFDQPANKYARNNACKAMELYIAQVRIMEREYQWNIARSSSGILSTGSIGLTGGGMGRKLLELVVRHSRGVYHMEGLETIRWSWIGMLWGRTYVGMYRYIGGRAWVCTAIM